MPGQPLHTDPYEKDLLVRIAAGEEAAFGALVERHWRNIYLHSLTYSRDPHRAEEITQDVFLQVWQHRAKLPALDSFPAWLHVIARNRIVSALRVKLQELASLPENAADDDLGLTSALTPAHQTEYREAWALLQQGIALLPEKRREVFRLSRLEGLSNLEIAERLDIHPVTVSQYLAKALVFLKTFLEEHQIEPILALILIGGYTLS